MKRVRRLWILGFLAWALVQTPAHAQSEANAIALWDLVTAELRLPNIESAVAAIGAIDDPSEVAFKLSRSDVPVRCESFIFHPDIGCDLRGRSCREGEIKNLAGMLAAIFRAINRPEFDPKVRAKNFPGEPRLDERLESVRARAERAQRALDRIIGRDRFRSFAVILNELTCTLQLRETTPPQVRTFRESIDSLLALYSVLGLPGNSRECAQDLGCSFTQQILRSILNGSALPSEPVGLFSSPLFLEHLIQSFSLVPEITFSGVLTPILFDLGPPGLDLTGLEGGVLFDIDADGLPELVSWTEKGSSDAFLAFDRNDNGVIDDGMELFGNAVVLNGGETAMQGYEALAEFDLDSNGGNGNGFVDARDQMYWKLRLWTDRNHNGISESDEPETLFSAGVRAIQLDFETGSETDEHGNIFAFTSPAYRVGRDGLSEVSTIDVLLGVRELVEPMEP